ncbi:uncharacterized protein LOC116340937 [Contarinia nasturtii]|uniref:uncharacterized protein LOC116340937 n=1 Tax=Contarinia nasturtii TaxID=265458 RepID=UPI0012D47838|nr:uncharacterized protein LOC116340937 [Contarinia nasturtii]
MTVSKTTINIVGFKTIVKSELSSRAKMKFLIQAFFAVAVFVSGYHCNICGPSKETLLVPEVTSIFKPAKAYTIHTDNLVYVFNQFKSSVDGVKKQLRGLQRDDSAGQILKLLSSSMIQFDMWVEDLVELERSNKNYVSGVTQSYKKFMSDNKDKIKHFQTIQMSELTKNIREDENAATKQRDEMDLAGNELREEMAKRKIQVDQIQVNLRNGKTSAPALREILNEIKPKFSSLAGAMLSIAQKLKELDTNKDKLRFAEKALKYN